MPCARTRHCTNSPDEEFFRNASASTDLLVNHCVYSMAIIDSESESGGSIAALFDEGDRLLNDLGSPMEQSTPPGAGKTPTTPSTVADLATAVDGGSGTRIYSPSSQGRLVLFNHVRPRSYFRSVVSTVL